MSNSQKIISKSYTVTADSQVKLSIIIGDGQLGIPVVVLDTDILRIGETNQLQIGIGRDLKSKTLKIKTQVNDINPKTNHTSITYILEGGPDVSLETNNEIVAENGGSITYNDQFTFNLQS